MRRLSFLLQKEFLQMFRDKAILRLIVIMPVMQLLLIPFAADYEIKHISLAVVDHDHSPYSRRLIDGITASGYFQLSAYEQAYAGGLNSIAKGQSDLVLTIPYHFERDLVRDGKAKVHLAADAVTGVKASLGTAYAQRIIMGFSNDLRQELITMPRYNELPVVEVLSANWYNPHFNYKLFMVPGILAILVTMVGVTMSSLNLVAEKEMGTIEQLNVTPLRKWEFVLGKLLPFWVVGLISLSIGLTVAFVVYGLMPVGSYLTILGFAALYLFGVLGIGLLMSTFSDTQQQVTLFSFFVTMFFVLMSGLYTPIESMPVWAQWLSKINPPTHIVTVIRSVFIKGSTFWDLRVEMAYIIGFAFVFNGLAIWNYRKRG